MSRWQCADACCGAMNQADAQTCVACGYVRTYGYLVQVEGFTVDAANDEEALALAVDMLRRNAVVVNVYRIEGEK